MIKKISPLLLLIALASCKKQYNCSCSTRFTYKVNATNYDTRYFPGTDEKISEKLSKKQAASACKHHGEAIQSSVTYAITDNGNYPLESGESITTECTVK